MLARFALAFVLIPGSAMGWEPMELVNGHIRIASQIGGHEGYSVIDTGAEINAINSIFLHVNKLDFERGDLKVRVGGVYGEEVRRTYRRIPVKLWGSEIPFVDVVDVNLRDRKMQMLIGAGFLKNFIFQFDYPNQRMRILPRKAVDMKKSRNVQSRRDPGGGSPLVRVSLDGKPVWLTLDTGNSGGILVDRSVAATSGWLDKYPRKQTQGFGAVSSGYKETFNMSTLKIGPFEVENPIVSVPEQGETLNMFKRQSTTGTHVRRGRGKSRGLLGFDILKHFVVTIDYKSGLIHLAAPE